MTTKQTKLKKRVWDMKVDADLKHKVTALCKKHGLKIQAFATRALEREVARYKAMDESRS